MNLRRKKAHQGEAAFVYPPEVRRFPPRLSLPRRRFPPTGRPLSPGLPSGRSGILSRGAGTPSRGKRLPAEGLSLSSLGNRLSLRNPPRGPGPYGSRQARPPPPPSRASRPDGARGVEARRSRGGDRRGRSKRACAAGPLPGRRVCQGSFPTPVLFHAEVGRTLGACPHQVIPVPFPALPRVRALPYGLATSAAGSGSTGSDAHGLARSVMPGPPIRRTWAFRSTRPRQKYAP